MIKIHIFHTGKVRVPLSVCYKSKNPFSFFSKEKIELPVSCYLIEHPKGKILIDTGWDYKYENKELTRFFKIEDKISHPIIIKEEAITSKLDKLNIKVEDLDYVILSHMDLDHISGLKLVMNAKKILVSKDNLKEANKNKFRYDKNDWKKVKLDAFDFIDSDIGPINKSYDLFGDKSILLINTPGHTIGHTSVMVRKKNKYVIIAGDCVYTHRSWKEKILPGFTVDKKLALKSIEWINKMYNDKNCIEILANHDYEVGEKVIKL